MPKIRHGPKMNDVARAFRLAGDPQRLRLLCLLFAKPGSCVTDLAEGLKMSVATASHHLQALAGGGLLEARRNGKRTCYALPRTGLPQELKRLICRYK